MLEDDLAQALAAAQRDGRQDVDQSRYATLSREQAYGVQARVQDLLGERTGAIKVGVAADGTGIVAPIFASRVGPSVSLKLPAANFIGLEVEVAAVLGRDVTPEVVAAGEDAMRAAIDHYVMGIEICAKRYADRAAAGPEGGIADGIGAFGYAYSTAPWTRGEDLGGLTVELEFAGRQVHFAPVKHSFGTVLNSYFAYARNQRPNLPLRAGLLVTTGSLCGLVAATGPGRAVARMGGQTVEVELVA